MKPDYLCELANLADPDKLWELGPFEALTLSKEKRVQLQTRMVTSFHHN
jgi:hypothetical protein